MARSTFDRSVVEGESNRVAPLMQDAAGGFMLGANLYGPVPAAGGLVSTPSDLAALARCLMEGGRTPDGNALFGSVTSARLSEPQVALDPEGATPFDGLPLWDDPRRFHALGPQLHRGVPGVTGDAVGHGGGVMGGTAYLLVAPVERRGVVVLANTHGYPLSRLALVALAVLGGEPPERLPFVRRERLLDELAGDYRAFRDTIRAELRPTPGGLELTLAFHPTPRKVPLVLFEHDEAVGTTRLLAFGQGRPAVAEVVRRDEPGRVLELRFERYALRRQGRLPS